MATASELSQPGSRSPSYGYQSSTSVGTKRKREESQAFYAVRQGHKPGIYLSNNEAVQQLKGFRNGQYKRFESRAEAERFMSSGPNVSSRFTKVKSQKFYGVRIGRVPGVYSDWASTAEQVEGFGSAKHKSFSTRALAQAFVNGDETPEEDTTVEKASSRKQRKISTFDIDESIEPGTGTMPPASEDGFDSRILLDPESGKIAYKTEAQKSISKMQPKGMAKGAVINIYTDGSALGNGFAGAHAGVGVYFGPLDPRNLSELLEGSKQTNNRAELQAIQRAVDIAPKDRNIKIFTDSEYAINCLTIWSQKWRMNGWKSGTGKPVDNRDLIEPTIAKLDERARLGSKTLFEWVKGHASEPGNIGADSLAVAASNRARSAALLSTVAASDAKDDS